MIENTRILIIDDDLNLREAYRKILTSSNLFPDLGDSNDLSQTVHSFPWKEYELILTARGEEGIQAVEQAAERGSPFAVAFVDMKMPGCDGAETVERIWGIDPKIKIVIVTGHVYYKSEELLNIAKRGDLCFFRKPFTAEEVRELAEIFTKKWSQEREYHVQSPQFR